MNTVSRLKKYVQHFENIAKVSIVISKFVDFYIITLCC